MATPTGLRERKKQQTREDILATALRLFRERGFEETRVRDICEQVQISEATFFNYFPSKDALLDAHSLGTADLYGALLHHELSFPERSVGDRVREIVRAVGQAFAAEREVMSLVITRSNLFFGSTGTKAERDIENYELFAQLFREGQESGEIRSDVGPHQLAEIISAAMMMTILNWLIGWWGSGQSEELDARLMRAVDVFLDGCRQS